jgi:hypothetical protein
VKHYLLTHPAAGNDINGSPVTVQSSGLKAVYAGAASPAFFGVSPSDPRHPDILGIAQHGVVCTGHMSKIAEHGGDDQQDRNVPILVALPGLKHGHVVAAPVETTQIAPTILALLRLPSAICRRCGSSTRGCCPESATKLLGLVAGASGALVPATRDGSHAMNFSRALLTWSWWVQEMACGPSSMTTICRSLIMADSRLPVFG